MQLLTEVSVYIYPQARHFPCTSSSDFPYNLKFKISKNKKRTEKLKSVNMADVSAAETFQLNVETSTLLYTLNTNNNRKLTKQFLPHSTPYLSVNTG